MRVLLDECVTRYLKRDLIGHQVHTLQEAGFSGLKNGELMRAAIGKYDVLVTVDQNIPYQQNLKAAEIAVLILVAKSITYTALKPLVPLLLNALQKIKPGEIIHLR